MKCRKPNTDQIASISLYANGIKCPEYSFSSTSTSTSSSDPTTISCFVPVSEGEQLTLQGTFTGTVLNASFDLLADGSFVSEKRIEAKGRSASTARPRKVVFEKVFTIPPALEVDHTVVEGSLQVKSLAETSTSATDPGSGGDGDGLGVGTIALIISLNQSAEDQYTVTPPYPDMQLGRWRQRLSSSGSGFGGGDGGIPPTHELDFVVSDDKLHGTRQSTFRRHFKQTRSGAGPWIRFVFFYRSVGAIVGAGCVRSGEEVVDLPISDGSRAAPAKRDKALSARTNRREGNMLRCPPESAVLTTATPSQSPKPKFFGLPLFGNGAAQIPLSRKHKLEASSQRRESPNNTPSKKLRLHDKLAELYTTYTLERENTLTAEAELAVKQEEYAHALFQLKDAGANEQVIEQGRRGLERLCSQLIEKRLRAEAEAGALSERIAEMEQRSKPA